MTIGELQEHVKNMRCAQGWDNNSVEQRTIFLMSEVGELAKEVLHLEGAYSVIDETAMKERIGLEIYDIVWNLCDLANLVGIDLETAFAHKQEINQSRTW
jgi:NTP pyrophosphatase (non-canonical NTP hydrolase)